MENTEEDDSGASESESESRGEEGIQPIHKNNEIIGLGNNTSDTSVELLQSSPPASSTVLDVSGDEVTESLVEKEKTIEENETENLSSTSSQSSTVATSIAEVSVQQAAIVDTALETPKPKRPRINGGNSRGMKPQANKRGGKQNSRNRKAVALERGKKTTKRRPRGKEKTQEENDKDYEP